MPHILRTGEPPVTPNPSCNRALPEHERIAASANHLVLGDGGQHGLDVRDWLAAEARVASQAQPAKQEPVVTTPHVHPVS